MNKFTIIIYDELGDHYDGYEKPIGEVDIRALDYSAAREVAKLMFENTGRVISVEENNDE